MTLSQSNDINADYYPFGMAMPGRINAPETPNRYGFQGQESDDEITGTRSHYSYEYRVQDARTGRFFSVDPLHAKYAYNSTYAFSENRVIDSIELEGLEKVEYWSGGKMIESVNWQEITYEEQEAFLRRHDIEGNWGRNKHPDSQEFQNGNKYQIWRMYRVYYDDVAGEKMYKYGNQSELEAGKAYQIVEFTGVMFGIVSLFPKPGTSDGANTGGDHGGKEGWETSGRKVLFGTLAVVTAPITIAGGGVYAILGSIGLVNGIDDIGTGANGESLTQQLVSDPNYKEYIANAKIGATFITAIGNGYQLWSIASRGGNAAELAPVLLGTANDIQSLVSSIELKDEKNDGE